MRQTRIAWRIVDEAEAERNGIPCAAFGYCSATAAYCRTVQTDQMSGPAFYYFCAEHAAEGAARDGIALEAEGAEAEANPYAVGSIWHTSWGYDQTNVEFYTVVRESKASVWLAPMGSAIRDGRQWPTVTTGLADAVSMHRKGKHGAYVRLDYVRSAWPYAGGGCYSTDAAGICGH